MIIINLIIVSCDVCVCTGLYKYRAQYTILVTSAFNYIPTTMKKCITTLRQCSYHCTEYLQKLVLKTRSVPAACTFEIKSAHPKSWVDWYLHMPPPACTLEIKSAHPKSWVDWYLHIPLIDRYVGPRSSGAMYK